MPRGFTSPDVTDAAGACPPTRPLEKAGTSPWYCLRLYVNREFQVRDALLGHGIEIFLPSWTEVVRWSDRTKTIVRPLFPGYVFARMTPPEFYTALATRGVVQILPSSHKPLPINEQEIDNVRLVVDSKLQAAPCDYHAGERVTIDSGALAGVSGVVVRTKGSFAVVVSVEILRRSVRVELPSDTLVRAEGKAA